LFANVQLYRTYALTRACGMGYRLAGQNLLVFGFARCAWSCPTGISFSSATRLLTSRLDISSTQNSASVIPSFPSAQQVRYMLEEGLRRKSVFSIAEFTLLGLASSRPTSDNRWQDESSRFCSTPGPINQRRD